MRRINLCFLAYLTLGSALVAVLMSVAHGFQATRIASSLLYQGRQARSGGDLGKAGEYFGRYLKFVPADLDVLNDLVTVLHDQAKTPKQKLKAFFATEELLRKDKDGGYHENRRRLVKIALEFGRIADAQKHITILQGIFPKDAELLDLLGQCQESDARYEESTESFRQAITLSSTRIECYERLAYVLLVRLERRSEADEQIEKMVTSNDQSFLAYLARARYLRKLGLTSDADDDVARALQLAPDELDVLVECAKLAMTKAREAESRSQGSDQIMSEIQRAREFLRRGRELFPQAARFYLLLSSVEAQASDRDRAIDVLREGLREVPDDDNLLWALAEQLILQKGDSSLREAEGIIASIRQRSADPGSLGFLTALLEYQNEEWYSASRELERVRPLLSQLSDLQQQVDRMLAACYEQLANPDLQLSVFRRAVKDDPTSISARLGLASALTALGRIEEAVAEYRLAVNLPGAPAFGWTQAVGWSTVGKLMIIRNLRLPTADRNWEQVEAALDKALADSPRYTDGIILRAHVQAAKGEWAEARAGLESAINDQPNEEKLRVTLADLVAREEGSEQAIQILEDAREQVGDSPQLRLAIAGHWARGPGEDSVAALRELADNREAFSTSDQAVLLRGLGETYRRMGMNEEARSLWGDAAKLKRSDIRIRFLLFSAALEQADDEDMQRWIAELRRIEGPGRPMGDYAEAARLISLAETKGKKDLLASARLLAEQAAVQRPSWSLPVLAKARIDDLNGSTEAAIGNYQKALELAESDARVVQRLVQLLYQRKRYVEADLAIRGLEKRAPLPADLQQIAGELSVRGQDFDRAIQIAREAVNSTPENYRHHLWLGQILLAAGKAADAEASFQKAVELGADHPDAWVILVLFLHKAGRTAEAETTIGRAQAELPADEAPLMLAQCYSILGRQEEAEQHFVSALQTKPDDVSVLQNAAGFYYQIGKREQGEPLLKRIVNDRKLQISDDLIAWARRMLAIGNFPGRTYPQFREALELVEQNLKADNRNVTDLRAKAMILLSRGSHRHEAIRVYEEIANYEALAKDERFVLAQLYQGAGDWSKYREQMIRLLAEDAQNATYVSHYARSLVITGRSDEAVSWLETIERLQPDAFQTIETKARLLVAQGETETAVQLLKDFLKKSIAHGKRIAAIFEEFGQWDAAEEVYRSRAASAERPETTLELAEYLGRRGRVKEALNICDTARQSLPPNVIAATSTNIIFRPHADHEQRERVVGWIEAAIQNDSDNYALWTYLAAARCSQERYADAVSIYSRILEANPGNLTAHNNLAWLLSKGFGPGADALRLINRAIELAGPAGEFLDTRAVVYMSLGQHDKAVTDLQLAIADDRVSARYFHLAEALWHVHDRAGARRALLQANEGGLKENDLQPLERPTYRKLVSELSKQ